MDQLLNAIKDFSSIKRCLEAINRTTDDFLYMFDIKDRKFEFFGPIADAFHLEFHGQIVNSLDQFLPIVHPADRTALREDVNKNMRGEIDSHDLDFRMFNNQNQTVWVNSRGKVLHDETGAPHLLIGRLSEENLRHLYNPDTGLWNTTKLRQDLKKHLDGTRSQLMLLGIPVLSSISLSHGRDFGKQLLLDMAEILGTLDNAETAYHIDNNNFAVIVRDCEPADVEKIYESIVLRMNDKCSVFAGAVPIDSSIFGSASALLDSAMITLQEASQNMTGGIAFFSVDQIRRNIDEFTLLEELRESVKNNFEGFEVHYQPQIRSGTYELSGVEALLRYHSPKRGRVFPDAFIPILEQSGLIDPVGMWVLERTLENCRQWRKFIPDLVAAVNVSPVQFEDPRLGERIVEALKNAQLPGDALTVELTESMQLGLNKQIYELIRYLKSYGVRVSIDDFGTGYSSLSYLKHLDVNEIKIGRSFVSGIEKDTYNYRLICNVIEFAKNNAIHTCCEGVETAKELSVLEPLLPDCFQGYLFDKPTYPEEIDNKYLCETSDAYRIRLQSIEEIRRIRDQYGSVHFHPDRILRANKIGLWILCADPKGKRFELHIDDIMAETLGFSEIPEPRVCYHYWHDHICPEDLEHFRNALETIVQGQKAVEIEYRWNHPSKGETLIRMSGILTQKNNDTVIVEGYHRALTGHLDCR